MMMMRVMMMMMLLLLLLLLLLLTGGDELGNESRLMKLTEKRRQRVQSGGRGEKGGKLGGK